MKRFALTSLSLALLGTAGAAHAQNSVTLYGVIDTGLIYVHNANGNEKLVGTNSGTLSGDRWGLKGQEDLVQAVIERQRQDIQDHVVAGVPEECVD